LAFQFDETNVALWQRYTPVQDESDDWQTYREFPGTRADKLGKRIRFLSLAQLVRHVRDLPGDFAECGCAAGYSTYMIARTMEKTGRTDELLVFDSFEGLSERTEEDRRLSPRHVDLYRIQADLAAGTAIFHSPLEHTQANLARFPFIRFYKGWIPERFAEVAARTFAFVHIDVDLYEPTRASLEFFWPRLARGGAIQVDDYNITDWPGAKAAVDEFRARNKPSFFHEIALGGAFLIK
jgi:O-methyltransferase